MIVGRCSAIQSHKTEKNERKNENQKFITRFPQDNRATQTKPKHKGGSFHPYHFLGTTIIHKYVHSKHSQASQ